MAFKSLDDLEFVDPDGKVLGEGGFSEVKLVKLKANRKLYALKCINLKSISHVHFSNLKKEIKIHQTLWHPHIIRFEGAIQEEHMVYILLEYADNGALFFFINPRTGMPEKYAFKFFYQVAQALEYLHSKGIMHRDIKPENILLDKNYDAKLCDFGWCAEHEEQDPKQSICGTYEYMPPEIVNEKPHNKEVDLWALGVLLYELIHGRAPYTAETMEEIKDRMKTHEISFKKSLSKEAKDIMLQLLRFDPAERLSLDKVFRHPFILKHIDEFECNRDSFKYIPPEPEWDNDLDIHAPLGADPNSTGQQKTFEDDILNDPIKQHEYIAKKLAEAKINPQDVEKVFFIRDDKNALKMRLQMKDRPQPKRGNSERKITTSFSQRFVPSVKKSDGSPRKYDENATAFENILRDNLPLEPEPEYTLLGDNAKEAHAFLKKFDASKGPEFPNVIPQQGGQDAQRNLKLNLGNQDLEYKLINDRKVPDFEPYSQEIMPSELGSPGRSDLAESISSNKRLEKMNSYPDNGLPLNLEPQPMAIQNPYSIGGHNGTFPSNQGLTLPQAENVHTNGGSQHAMPLTLNTTQKKEKSESPPKETANPPSAKKEQPLPQPSQANPPQEQPRLISIKSSDNLFKYEISQDPHKYQHFNGSVTPPPTNFHRPMNTSTGQQHQLYPFPPFNADGPVNQSALTFARSPQAPDFSQNFNMNMPPIYPQQSFGPMPGFPMQQPDFSGYQPWGAPPSFMRQNEQGHPQHGGFSSATASHQIPPQAVDFKVKDTPQVNKADPITPISHLGQLKSPLNQSLKLHHKEEPKSAQDKNLAQPKSNMTNNYNPTASQPFTSPGVPQPQSQGQTSTGQQLISKQQLGAQQLQDKTNPFNQNSGGKQESNAPFQSPLRASDHLQTGAFRPISVTGSPFKSEKLLSSPSKPELRVKEEPPQRVPLEDLSKVQNLPSTTITPRKDDLRNDAINEPEIRYRKLSANLEEENARNVAAQLAATYNPANREGTKPLPQYPFTTDDKKPQAFGNNDDKSNQLKGEVKSYMGGTNQPALTNPTGNTGYKSYQVTPTKSNDQPQQGISKPVYTSLSDYNKQSRNPTYQPSNDPKSIQITSKPSDSYTPYAQTSLRSSVEQRESPKNFSQNESKNPYEREKPYGGLESGASKTLGSFPDSLTAVKSNPTHSDMLKASKDYIRDGDRINKLINGNNLTDLKKESPQKQTPGQFFPQESTTQRPTPPTMTTGAPPMNTNSLSDRSTYNPLIKNSGTYQNPPKRDMPSDLKQGTSVSSGSVFNRQQLTNLHWGGESAKDISSKLPLPFVSKEDQDRSLQYKPISRAADPSDRPNFGSRKNSGQFEHIPSYLPGANTKDSKKEAGGNTNPTNNSGQVQQTITEDTNRRIGAGQRDLSRPPQDTRPITITSQDRSRSQNITRKETNRDFATLSGLIKPTNQGGNSGLPTGNGTSTSFSRLPEQPSAIAIQERLSRTTAGNKDQQNSFNRENPVHNKPFDTKPTVPIGQQLPTKRPEDVIYNPLSVLTSKKMSTGGQESPKINKSLSIQSNTLNRLMGENQPNPGIRQGDIPKPTAQSVNSIQSKESSQHKDSFPPKNPFGDTYNPNHSEHSHMKTSTQPSQRSEFGPTPFKMASPANPNPSNTPGGTPSSQLAQGRDSYYGRSDKVTTQFGGQPQNAQTNSTINPMHSPVQSFGNAIANAGLQSMKPPQDSPANRVVISSKIAQTSMTPPQQPAITVQSAQKPTTPHTGPTQFSSPNIFASSQATNRQPSATVIYGKRQ